MEHLQGHIEGVAAKRESRSTERHSPQWRKGQRAGNIPSELIRHVWSHIELSRKIDQRIYLDEITVGVLEPLSPKAVSIRLVALAAYRHTLSWIASVAGRVLNESCFETSCSKYGPVIITVLFLEMLVDSYCTSTFSFTLFTGIYVVFQRFF
jgi:hypothetical protein